MRTKEVRYAYNYNNSFNWEKIEFGDEIAVVTGNYTEYYQFGNVSRVTATKVIVDVVRNDKSTYQYEFSRINGKVMGKHKSVSRYDRTELVTAVYARQQIEKRKVADKVRSEAAEIRQGLKALAENISFSAEGLAKLDEVREKLAAFIAN